MSAKTDDALNPTRSEFAEPLTPLDREYIELYLKAQTEDYKFEGDNITLPYEVLGRFIRGLIQLDAETHYMKRFLIEKDATVSAAFRLDYIQKQFNEAFPYTDEMRELVVRKQQADMHVQRTEAQSQVKDFLSGLGIDVADEDDSVDPGDLN